MLELNASVEGDAPLVLPETGPTSFHERLRKATRPSHDEVDALFGQFDLGERGSYGDFLAAHARALIPLEDWIDIADFGAAPRAPALRADLEALARPLVEPAPLAWPRSESERWGAAYVIEGSRLGGLVLLRAISSEFPCDYLAAAHPPGAWRAFLARIDRLAVERGALWEAEAIAAAKRVFELFADAAVAWGALRGR